MTEISVVIPTRDRWDMLAAALDSVLQQRGVHLEVIVVDDGSRDGAPRTPPFDDPRIRILRHDRSVGVASARNAGVAAASGEWVAFLDDDDVWAPDKLRAQLDAARTADASFAYASVLLARDDTGTVTRADAPPPERLADLLAAYNAIPAGASNVIAKTDLVRGVGGFDPDLFHLADWDLWIRLSAAGRGAACPRPLVEYRLHAGSMRSTAGGVLRELRRLDSKHGRGSLPPERIWLYRWLAEGQLLAGHRASAALTYIRGAVRCRSRSDLLRAATTLLSAAAMDARRQELRQRVRLLGALLIERALRFTGLRAGAALVYHEVVAVGRVAEDEVVPAVDRSLFRAQLAHLASRYRLVRAGELFQATRQRRRGERFPVAITFDDDLRSHVELALPLLREAGAAATFFLTGASLHGPASFWWERVQRAVDEEVPLDLEAGEPSQAIAAVSALSPSERAAFSTALLERLGGERPGSGLRVEHVEALARAGFEIGFHTRAHESLVDLDDERLSRAMREGADEVEAPAGAPVRTIAYPHGQADARVAAAARVAGYQSGFTTDGATIRADTDPLLMGRLYPSRASLAHFAAQVSLALWRTGAQSPVQHGGDGRGRMRRVAGDAGVRIARRLAAKLTSRPPAVGDVQFGDLRRLTPMSRQFGLDRGLPVDRHYVEDFLRRHAGSPEYGGGDIRGHVMEVGGDEYARRFGGWSGESSGTTAATSVTDVDVLHADGSNPQATIVGDLASGAGIPDDRYDCVICTQTLQVIYDVEGAVRTLHRVLRPGGVALVTVAGITQACRPDRDLWGDYWRFTTLSVRRLFEAVFPPDRVEVEAYGNVLASIAFLYGLAAGELTREELDLRDPDYELLICVRVHKETG